MSTGKGNEIKKISYPIYEMKEKGKIILTPKVINQIMYLHANIGKTEWSGILLYDVISGHPSKPADFVLKAEHIFLMDIGSAAFTEYETDGDIVDIYNNIENAMDMKIGHVHSHHDMGAFFSGTDNDELMENVDKHNYYVSLIVNFSGNYVAKVAFLSEVETTTQMLYTDDHGELQKEKEETITKTMIVTELKIALEYNEEFFYNRITQVREKIKAAKAAKEVVQYKSGKWGGSSKGKPFRYSEFGFEKDEVQRIYNSMGKQASKSNPKELSTTEVEHLTRNIVAVDTDLKETRTTYTLLHILADSKDGQMDFYKEFLGSNIENIINKFFDSETGLAYDELESVIGEVAMSIKRFQAIKRLQKIIPVIIEVLDDYLKFSQGFESALEAEKEEDKKVQTVLTQEQEDLINRMNYYGD